MTSSVLRCDDRLLPLLYLYKIPSRRATPSRKKTLKKISKTHHVRALLCVFIHLRRLPIKKLNKIYKNKRNIVQI